MQADAQQAIADNCGESATCRPPVEIVGEEATNLDAAKALVATARKVSIEAVEAIQNELDGESEGYNPDNIVVKLQSAEALLDERSQDVLSGFREVSDVFLNQISAVEFGAEPTLQAPHASLTDAAGYLWQKYGSDTDYLSQADTESHFPAGSISRQGRVWTLSGGIYDIDGDASTTADQVAVDMQIDLAALSGELGSMNLSAGENAFTIEGTAARGDVVLSLTDASQVKLNLAESFAEYLHKQVRTESWGYAPDEELSNEELIKEAYRGIRPAPGYPACPDHSEKATLFKLLNAEQNTGVSLTEHFAMLPAASVSGWYFAHPEAKYFNVGKIGRDQLQSLAQRKGIGEQELERWLRPNLED